MGCLLPGALAPHSGAPEPLGAENGLGPGVLAVGAAVVVLAVGAGDGVAAADLALGVAELALGAGGAGGALGAGGAAEVALDAAGAPLVVPEAED